MGLIDQIEEMNMQYARQFSDLYNNLSEKQGKKFGETPGNPIFTDDVNLHRMPTVLDNMYGFLKIETSTHYKTMDSKFTVTNKLIGELIDITYQMWGESQNFNVEDYISESNSQLADSIEKSNNKFYEESERYHRNSIDVLQEMLDGIEEPEPVEIDPKQHNEIKDGMKNMSDKLSKVGNVVGAGVKTALGSFSDKLLTFGTHYYDNEFTNKIADSVENVESIAGSGLNKIGQMTSSLTSGLKGIANSLTGGLGNLADIYTDPQVQQAFARYGSKGLERAQELYGERIDIMKELIRDYGYSESEAKKIATQEMTRTGTRDYSRLTYEQQLSDQRNEMDYQRSIKQRRAQEQRDWSQSALLSAVEIFKTPKQISTAQEQIYEMDRIMPGLNFQATEFYKTMISVFDDTGKMGKEMFEEIRNLSKNLMVDPQTLLSIGDTYTKYLKLMTKGGISFQKQMTNVIKVTAKLEDQFIDSQGVFGEINEIGFTMLSNMSDDLLTKTQLYSKELGMSVTEFQKTARSAPAEAAELLLSAKRSYTERMGINASSDIGEREMALLQQIGITGYESIAEFLGQSQADLSRSEQALTANQGTELGPLQRQLDLSNEAWERQLTLLDREYDRRTDAWQTEQKILHDWENEYYTDWEKRQMEMDKDLLENKALDTWNNRLMTASNGLKGIGNVADETAAKIQLMNVGLVDGLGSFAGTLLGNLGGKTVGKIGGKLFGGKNKNATDGGTIDTSVFDQNLENASSKGASINWKTVGQSFTIIAGGIALVAGSVYILSKIDTDQMKRGAENTRIVGEAFSELYEPVGIVLTAGAALGWLMQSKIVKWEYLGAGLLAIEAGIAAVAVPIHAIGSFNTKTFERGRDNSELIGEAMNSLYLPVGIIIAASTALGALFISTGGMAAGAMITGLIGIEVGIAGVAAPIKLLGEIDTQTFIQGRDNAQLIGEAMDSLYKPVSLTIAAAMALGGIFTGTLGIGWVAMKSGLEGMHTSLNEIGSAIKDFGNEVKGVDTGMVANAANAGLLLTKLQENLPKEGGFFSLFTGKKKSISEFGTELISFGKGLRNFGEEIKDLSSESITNSSELIDFIIGIDYDKINDIDSKKFKNKLQDIAEGIKSYATINFDDLKDISTQLTLTMKFTDFDSGEVGTNIITIVDLNGLRNKMLERIQKSIEITNKKINNFNWDSNSRLNSINSNVNTIKSTTLTTMQNEIVKAINNIATGFKPFWKMVDDAKNGNKTDPFKAGGGDIDPSENNDPYAKYGVTSAFGKRKRPIAGASTNHKGTDYGIPRGAAIPAFNNSIVIGNGYDKSSGNYVVLQNSEGYKFSFCHLDSKSPLKLGDSIVPGTTIGYCGSTGASTGPHLHLGIRNPKGDFIDPQKYFESNPGIGRNLTSLEKLNNLFTEIGIVNSLTDLDTLDLTGDKKDFVSKMLRYASMAANLLGTTPGTLLAQWALESGWGTSKFARTRNNFAGINAIDADPNKATSYKSPADFAQAYARFVGVNPDGSRLNTSYMRSGIFGTSGSTYYSILKKNGYATDPNYVSKLTSIYNNLGIHKTGLSRVPYDDYPALLHKDERVLNPAEAQMWNNIQESRMGEYEPSIQDITVYVDTDAIVDSISALTDVVQEIHKILKPKSSAPVQQTVRPKSNLITQYV